MGPKAPVGEPRPPVPRPRQMGPGNRAGPGDPAGEGSSRGGPVADPARGAVGEGWALVREGFCGRTGGERRVVSEPSAWRRVAAVRQSSRPAAPRMSGPVQTEATRRGSSRHLFKIGEQDPVLSSPPRSFMTPRSRGMRWLGWSSRWTRCRLEPRVVLVPDPAAGNASRTFRAAPFDCQRRRVMPRNCHSPLAMRTAHNIGYWSGQVPDVCFGLRVAQDESSLCPNGARRGDHVRF